MSAGTIVGAAVLALVLIAVPGEPDPAYTADCADNGTAIGVEPDTRANREAAADWCTRLVVFQRAETAVRRLDSLWGK